MTHDPSRVFLPEPEPLDATDSNGSRWRPLRSGIINLFKYDNEVFPFENGRLLLRGNNGTGKSRVLALQLPFLLEGDIHSSRVEPDADSAKRFEWHLLMGKDTPTRTGYTWMEFGRRDANGQALFQTLGCGMKISRGGKLDRWHFITNQRIGKELRLVRDDGSPLPKDLLKAALGDERIYPTNREYARAVDEHLFHVGEKGGVREERYKALIDLLVELRRPQLSRELDEKKINRILASALPAPDTSMLADVAEGFESLERDRIELQAYKASEAAVSEFAKIHTNYLRYVVSLRAAELTAAHSKYDRNRRQLAADKELLSSAESVLRDAIKEEHDFHRAYEKAETEKNAFLQSPGMDVVKRLQELKDDSEKKQAEADRVEEEVTVEHGHLERSEQDYQNADNKTTAAYRAVEKERKTLDVCCVPLQVSCPPEDAGKDENIADREENVLKTALDRLDRTGRNLRQERNKMTGLFRVAEDAKKVRVAQEARHAAAQDRRGKKRDRYIAVIAELMAQTVQWLAKTTQITLEEPDAVTDALAVWTELPEGENPFRKAVDAGRLRMNTELTRLRTESEARSEQHKRERKALLDEKDALEKGIIVEPRAPYWRSTEVRLKAERSGAPLWRLCDFRDGLSEAERAGYEAALEASGLLDAWLSPDGEWVGKDGDVYIDTSGCASAFHGGLSRVLCHSPDPNDLSASALSSETVEAALAVIGHCADSAESAVWVSAVGDWRNGALSGRHIKRQAEFIGAGARAWRRRQRLGEIAALVENLDELIVMEQAVCGSLDERQRQIEEEYRTQPSDEGLREAWSSKANAEDEVRREYETLELLIKQESRALDQAYDARKKYDIHADDLGLAEWKDKLDLFENAIRGCLSQLINLDRAWSRWRSTIQIREIARAEKVRMQERYDACLFRKQSAARELELASEAYAALHKVSGATAHRAQLKLDQLVKEAQGAKSLWESSIEKKDAANTKKGAKNQKVDDQSALCDESEAARGAALDRFRIFMLTGVLAELDITGSDLASDAAMTPIVELARACDELVPEAERSDKAWSRMKNQLSESFETLKINLSSQDLSTSMELRDDVHVVEVKYNGSIHRIGRVLEMLGVEVADRSRILTERERELLENHLVGEVADHLHRRIHEAHTLVAEMNDELKNRRTSTGLQLKFEWDVAERKDDDDPNGYVRAACAILARQAATWTHEDRQELARFLQGRIQLARIEDEAVTWRESVAKAVDYRPWHVFKVWRYHDKTWMPLTRKTHGTGSGGEKAVTLTIPLFAAAAAHYHSAPLAPRLIMLDEAFVGIDRDTVNECMGLLAKFDLDFVMTSEREWGTYPTIDGLSICWLSVHPEYDAVDVSHWKWEGQGSLRRVNISGDDDTMELVEVEMGP